MNAFQARLRTYAAKHFFAISDLESTVLPSNFKPAGTYDLIRVGKDRDGGYLVERSSIEKAKSLISMGINKDWSFEKDFEARTSVPLDAYDHTISRLFQPRYLVKSFLKMCLLRVTYQQLKKDVSLYKDYHSFFIGKNVHYSKRIGLESSGGVSLTAAFNRKRQATPVFFKIDIEGSEYRVLNELVDHAAHITGLAIEFHDADLHRDRIEAFIQKFPLTLVHIHPNNYGGVGPDGNPCVLEMTFANSPRLLSDHVLLPHPLDQRNKSNAEDYALAFEE